MSLWIAAAHAGAFETPQAYLDGLQGADFTGVVQVYEGERVAHSFAAGAQVDGEAIDGDSLFWVGSISKHVAAVAALRQVELGALALDRPVADYLEEMGPDAWRLDGEPCTVERVLSHTCGLPRDWKDAGLPKLDEDDPASVAAFLEAAGQLGLESTPGAEYAYSNLGFEVAGLLVARVAGRPYEQALSEIVAPTGLSPLTTRADRAAGFPEQLAPGTAPLFGHWLRSEAWFGVPMDFGEQVGAAGNVLASASALGPWFRRVIRGELLGAQAQAELLAPRLNDYALGLVVEEEPLPFFWHNGALAPMGYQSFVAHVPQLDRTVVVLSNQQPAALSTNDIGMDLVDLLAGDDAAPPDAGVTAADSVLTIALLSLTALAIPCLLLFGALGRKGRRLPWALSFVSFPWAIQLASKVMGASVGWGVIAAGLLGLTLGVWRRRDGPLWANDRSDLGTLALNVCVVGFLVTKLGGIEHLAFWVTAAAAIAWGVGRLGVDAAGAPPTEAPEP